MKFSILLTSIIGMLAAAGCGLTEPDYRQYSGADSTAEGEAEETDGETSGDDGSQTCEEQVLAAFGLIQSAVNNTCGNAGCHGDGTGGGLTLTPGDPEATEAALAAFVGGDSNKLISKLSEGGTHSGGPQIPNTLSESAITSWQAAKGCQ